MYFLIMLINSRVHQEFTFGALHFFSRFSLAHLIRFARIRVVHLRSKVYRTARLWYFNQLLQLCTARTLWFNPVTRSVSVYAGKCTTRTVTNEKKNTELTKN